MKITTEADCAAAGCDWLSGATGGKPDMGGTGTGGKPDMGGTGSGGTTGGMTGRHCFG